MTTKLKAVKTVICDKNITRVITDICDWEELHKVGYAHKEVISSGTTPKMTFTADKEIKYLVIEITKEINPKESRSLKPFMRALLGEEGLKDFIGRMSFHKAWNDKVSKKLHFNSEM